MGLCPILNLYRLKIGLFFSNKITLCGTENAMYDYSDSNEILFILLKLYTSAVLHH
jgi:hypothetical protein